MVWRRWWWVGCVLLACEVGAKDDGASADDAATHDSGVATDTDGDSESGGPAGTCPAPDPTLSPVNAAQAASTQAAYSCMSYVGCACDGASHDTVPSCRHGANMSFERVEDDAIELGLVYDGLCLAQAVADLQAIACDVDVDAAQWSVVGTGHCGVYHGDRAIGDPCTTVAGGVSDCAQGLACWHGVCVDPCTQTDAGERCLGVFGFACAPGLVCTPSGDCEAPLAPIPIGEPCDGGPCVDGAWCREGPCGFEVCEYTCVADLADGEACTYDLQCSSGFCGGDVCTSGPVTGEACVAERCFEGRECVDGACGPPEAAICPPR